MKQKIKTMMPWILTLASAAMGIVAFFLIFAPSVKYDFLILGNNTFTGINVTLGYTINKTTTVFHASAGMIFAYLLPLLGACVAVVGKGLHAGTGVEHPEPQRSCGVGIIRPPRDRRIAESQPYLHRFLP